MKNLYRIILKDSVNSCTIDGIVYMTATNLVYLQDEKGVTIEQLLERIENAEDVVSVELLNNLEQVSDDFKGGKEA